VLFRSGPGLTRLSRCRLIELNEPAFIPKNGGRQRFSVVLVTGGVNVCVLLSVRPDEYISHNPIRRRMAKRGWLHVTETLAGEDVRHGL